MFKSLFKTNQQQVGQPTVTKTRIMKPVTSMEIQEEMHAELRFILENNKIEVNTNAVNELKEANLHIITKAEKLKSLGFVNTPSVTVKEELDEKLKVKEKEITLEKEDIHLTNVYALQFPGYKFVPTRIFDSVRDKYDLYSASTDRYIKEIPEKNLDEVVNFMGLVKNTYEFGANWFRSRGQNRWSQTSTGTKEEMDAQLKRYTEYQTKSGSRLYDDCVYEVRLRTDILQITAPISHFNLQDSEVKGREITTKRPVLDPIVSHKVNGGYIIVSAWDKEAEIPEIQNPMNN